jgi:hypothetical protein
LKNWRLKLTKEELDNILLNLGDLLAEGEQTVDFQNAPLDKEQVELVTGDKTVPSADKPVGSVATESNKQFECVYTHTHTHTNLDKKTFLHTTFANCCWMYKDSSVSASSTSSAISVT